MIDITSIRERFLALSSHLDERGRRIFAASEARSAGYGGVAAVSRATGIAASTIGRGLAELSATNQLAPNRVRRPGGGDRPLVTKDPTLLADLLAMVEPDARGDPMSPLRWTCKSLSQLASALVAMGHKIGRSAVGDLLHREKFSLQANRKTREGDAHPDRDAQFKHLNESVRAALAEGEPVISVDTKKKELVGDFKNAGRTWRPRGEPEEVRVHDFLVQELGRAAPYGVYDLAANAGWVGVGMNNDTAAFAVQTIRRWWQEAGRIHYPLATRLTITADGGGSNGSRLRLWKIELQRLATELGIDIAVHHLPPGTSSRVDDWRGSGRSRGVAVSGGFRHVPVPYFPWTVAPFPVAARQTGRADFPHPAFSCLIRPSHSAGRSDVVASCKGRACCRDTRSGIGDTRCLLVHCVEPTSVADAVAHTSAPTCRSAEPAPG
jgi:hypothetical protein